MSEAPRDILLIGLALPFAPVQRFEEGLDIMTIVADRIAGAHPPILQFMRYMRTRWLPLKDKIVVERGSLQGNEMCANFNAMMVRKLGETYPTVWAMFGAYTSDLPFIYLYIFFVLPCHVAYI